jgi:hypothetical protein
MPGTSPRRRLEGEEQPEEDGGGGREKRGLTGAALELLVRDARRVTEVEDGRDRKDETEGGEGEGEIGQVHEKSEFGDRSSEIEGSGRRGAGRERDRG